MTGNRGDILLPTHLIMQNSESYISIPNEGLTRDGIAEFSGRRVSEGPVLTVLGTLLQNRKLLHFYRKLWHCVGLEMEGSHYAQQIIKAIKLGLLDSRTALRFLYYVSDLPIDPASNLSTPMAPWEGVPPLYATTRLVLREVFQNT